VPKTVRELIDQYLSLGWCNENIIVPLGIEQDQKSDRKTIIIAIANFAYLATIGEFVKNRFQHSGLKCQFIELPSEEIEAIIANASKENVLAIEDEESSLQYTRDEILRALSNCIDEVDMPEEAKLEFDDSDEANLEESILDLSVEILGSEVQKAAAQILISACRSNVSDIHIEPRQDQYKVRVRRDGVMQSYISMPRSAGIKLTTCLKNMAHMDIAERCSSQDGRILRHFEGQQLELRCSTVPTKLGEKMVLRILESNTGMLSLDTLITDEEIARDFRSLIQEANGIIVVSGPTGSGKSTTLASVLREKDNGELNIVTAEDPIEYYLGGNICQTPVLRAKGQTFANLLRTFLRQDPDVILIGETRDPETAEASIDAAETGHLVFTVLHANSASSALMRLVDMGVPTYKITASLRCILAQRLMRRVCPGCSSVRTVTEEESRYTGLQTSLQIRVANALSEHEKEQSMREGRLCAACSGIGYRGRIGTYELLKITPSIRQAIKNGEPTQVIEDIAVEEGMLTLKAYAVKLVANQLTTISELIKICGE